jgi:peroxiredoxin
MKTVLMATAAAAALVALAGVAAVNAAPTPTPAITAAASVPEKIDNFQLTDTARMSHELFYFKRAPAIVLMSQVDGTPLSRAAAAELSRLQAAYKDKGVLFYMINSTDTRDAAAVEVAKNKFDVPVLSDDLQLVGEQLNIRREGEVFVIVPKEGFKVAYHGPLDDRFNSEKLSLKAAAKNAYAASAIDAVLAGSTVANARVDLKAGKLISFPERAKVAQHAKISYTGTIAPILQAKCVSCHEKGGIAPFAMNSYEVVKGFAPMIRESVRTRRMPPWFADRHIGSWANDMGLSETETKTLIHWIEAGAPRGEGEDILKTHASEAPEWPAALGKPDMIVKLDKYDIPAKGVIPYKHATVDNPFPSDVYIRAVAFKPTGRPVLHHITSGYIADPKQPPKIPSSSVGSFVPGAGTQIYQDGIGAPVPVGGKFSYSLHYTSTGKAMSDQTEIGYYFTKKTPDIIRREAIISDAGINIPAGEARHKEVSYLLLPADITLYSLHAHAHYRGYQMEMTAVTPDGKETPVLSLPKYDFNWQLDYDLKEPMHFKAGTKMVLHYTYDNSSDNKNLSKDEKDADGNPLPSYNTNVKWGEYTYQEMFFFRMNYRWDAETSSNVRKDLQDALMATRTFGMLDDNLDNKLTKAEVETRSPQIFAKFAEVDTNHDGVIDLKELNASSVANATSRQIRDADAALE